MERAHIDIHVHAVPRAGYIEHDLWERTVFRFLRQEGGIADTPHETTPLPLTLRCCTGA